VRRVIRSAGYPESDVARAFKATGDLGSIMALEPGGSEHDDRQRQVTATRPGRLFWSGRAVVCECREGRAGSLGFRLSRCVGDGGAIKVRAPV